MPKTNEKDAFYFPHDFNARNDPKILALRSVFGAEGYGVYFMLVEILREQPNYKLPANKYLYNALAMQMQVQKEKVQEIVEACCTEFCEAGVPLLVNDGEYLYSVSLLRRMGKANDISNARREAARKRWENQPCKAENGGDKCKDDANAMLLQSKPLHTIPDQTIPDQTRQRPDETETRKKPEKKKTDLFADFAANDADLLFALKDFDDMRKKIKKPMTDKAKERMLAELCKLSQDRDIQIAILNQSTDNCWAGVFALKQPDSAYRQHGGSSGGKMDSADKLDALRDLHDAYAGGGVR